MRKIIFFTVLGLALVLVPKLGMAACHAENIVIDGEYDDWADCEKIATDTTGETTNMMYWNNQSEEWTTTDPGYDTWTLDDAAMLDLKQFKMLNDAENVYFMMKNAWPMMAMMAPDGEYFDFYQIAYYGQYPEPALDGYAFVPSELPDFDHWMVWSFDKNMDGIYDYYFGAHLFMPDPNDQDSSDVNLGVFKDDGSGSFEYGTDTLLASIDEKNGKTSMDEGQNTGSLKFEIRQNIEQFYNKTGISFGDEVKVRMETRSEIGDTTKGKKYTFDLGAPQNRKVKKRVKKAFTLKWAKNDYAKKYIVKLYTKKKKLIEKYTTKKSKLRVTGLKKGKTYKWRVRSKKKKLKSAWSPYRKAKTKK